MKRALITGINGMDGSHLADFLLEKGYKVFGMERHSSIKNRTNTSHLELNENFEFITGDLTDSTSLLSALSTSKPDEVYNLGSQSFVAESWNTPEQTSNVTGLGSLRMLDAIRTLNMNTKFYQASTSELFGRMIENPATERTPFYPRSPYGVSKLYAHWITKNYRESYDMFNACGILFNHESERRGKQFVTRKISDGIARIHHGLQDFITLGNLEAKRDWGYAPDYVESMWLMLQQDEPDDFVIATGKTHTIREFLDSAFEVVGITNWEKYIKQDPRFMRPAEVDVLRGDASKAKYELGWTPKTDLKGLVKNMVESDIALLDPKGWDSL
jgi:GDPmannose 4,6-dehydratase